VNTWHIATAVFLAYLVCVAGLLRGLAAIRRLKVAGGAILGAALLAVSRALPPDSLANVLILPGTLLFLGYWTSGLLFVRPMPRAERVLATIDTALGIDAIAARIPRPIAEFLEFAYAAVYAIIPIALFFALRQGTDVIRFWTVVTITDYICFGVLPWIQTRPPRTVCAAEPWRSVCRTINLRIVGATSIQVNTFPSGHAAEALVAALLVSDGPIALQVWMFFNAAAISAGAVFGRYHYAADAVAGWAVALLVYCSFRL